MGPLHQIDEWQPENSSAGWITSQGQTDRHGPSTRVFALASITKALFAYAVLISLEEGTLSLDQPAGPAGSTVRHLLTHTSGLGFNAGDPTRPVQQRRIYSNAGFEELGRTLSLAAGMPATHYWSEAVAEPLGMTSTAIDGSVAHAGTSSVEDLLRFASELLNPTLVAPETLRAAREPQFGDLDGIVPGYGHQSPCPWGLGFELRGLKKPHWTGTRNSPATFGHFGAKGTMLWVDPHLGAAAVSLSDKDFGQWAIDAWPPLNDAIIEHLATNGLVPQVRQP